MIRRVTVYRLKFGGGYLSAAVGLFVVVPILSADVANIGLTNRYVDVVLQNISMGRTYEIGRVQSQKFSVSNQGKTTLSLKVEKEIPDASFLKPGYESIPDPSWLNVSPAHFKLDPGESLTGRITLRVPKDARWKGRHYQASLWTHSADGPMAVGIRSYIRFSIETGQPPITEAIEKSANVKIALSPGANLNALAGVKSEIGTVTVKNENQYAVTIRVRSVHSRGERLSNAIQTPNPEFVKLSSELVDVPARSSMKIALFADIPAGGAHFGKTYAFSIRAEELNNSQPIFTDLYLHIVK